MLDFFHVTEYLGKVAYAAYPQKTGKPNREQWLSDRCHRLKHEVDAAAKLIKEMSALCRKKKLTSQVRDDLNAALTYFKNYQHMMNYATHVDEDLPIGSGVTEAACKTLVKQEQVQWQHYQTRHEAQQDILEYISMFYNSQRLHFYLDYMSPCDYEQQLLEMKKAA